MENLKSKILTILPTISKPTRYLGNELNSVRKEAANDASLVRFALAFPDVYDVGMSHLGLKILYHILNSRDDVWAERVYAPWIDMEREMRAKGIPLFSLESASPLRDFDIVGFSLQYEMSYTNVLNMLELAQIPLLAADRDGEYPLVIAGGPCAFNPEPMADFIDLFVIGDGEEVITEIVDCYKSHRDGVKRETSNVKRDREKILSKMADIEGVYVPLFASMEEQQDGTVTVSNDIRVRKRIVEKLDGAPYPVDYLVPFMRPIHDRAIIEVMRGCSRGCRFCQAGMIYRPVRERSPAVVERLAEELVEETGYEELSLSSLSTCDHSSIYEIVQQLVESVGTKKHVSISLPSLRTDAFSIELARKLGSTGKTGLTFAPEVATERMQRVINKKIPESEVLSTVESAFSTGWDSLKLYFMIGLPTETEEDVAEIARLIQEILHVALRANRRAKLNISVSTFVPKAHTPFQWERQLSLDEIQQRQNILMDRIGKNRRVKVSFHSPQVSYLEGVFARGDRRLGQVLRTAHALGCKLDGWSEFFNFDAWMQAFTQCGIDPDVYQKARKHDQVMPWDHVDAGLCRDFLLAERDKAEKEELTPDCRWGKCTGCGVCSILDTRYSIFDSSASSIQHPEPSIQYPVSSIQHPVSRIRFQFAKRDEVKLISHLDLLNALTRAFRRAGVPIAYSHGYNPHPKISFGSVLPVGTTSEAEFADVDLEVYMEPDDFIVRANHQLPPGLELLKAQEITLKARSLMAQIDLASYIVVLRMPDSGYRIPDTDIRHPASGIQNLVSRILDMDHIWIERPRKAKKKVMIRTKRQRTPQETSSFVDIRPLIRSIRLVAEDTKHKTGKPEDQEARKPESQKAGFSVTDRSSLITVEMVLSDGKAGKVRPEELVRLIFGGSVARDQSPVARELETSDLRLATSDFPASSIEIRKTGSFIECQGQLFSPMEIIKEGGVY